MQPILIQGEWRPSRSTRTFTALNPATKQPLAEQYPVSPWAEIDAAVQAAAAAFREVRNWPGERFAAFLEAYAAGIEKQAARLVELANIETALPVAPRLKDVELPRTINQLKTAAKAAREESWRQPVIDVAANIRSQLGPAGPVAVFGPNNFPFAFNSIAGGDFAAAVAAGNPVIGKGHPTHPGTTKLFAEIAQQAATATGMPPGFVQLIYRTSHEDGAKLVSHPLLAASGYTGARGAGLALKAAADAAGKPIYLELSSINPLYLLPGVIAEKGEELATEFAGSALMGAGQFCTNPGVVFMIGGPATETFIQSVAAKYQATAPGTLLGEATEQHLRAGIVALQQAGADVVTGNQPVDGTRCCHANTLLRTTGEKFLKNPHGLQSEAFGNCSLIVVCRDADELLAATAQLEGNLTGCVYSAKSGADDALYDRVAAELRFKVGRLLNDKMPTGVAVSPAMNHGGPYPSTGHAGFTAVGIPAALRRFAVLHCYDNVREARLPATLRNKNPSGQLWRSIDGKWTTADVG